MENRLHYLAIWITLFVFPTLQAQELRFRVWNATSSSYNPAIPFPQNGVADDFGPRRYGDNMHLGVDYNSAINDGNADKWNLILAPSNGVIVDVNRLRTSFSYKQLCYQSNNGTHRYIFGHVYDNSAIDNTENGATGMSNPANHAAALSHVKEAFKGMYQGRADEIYQAIRSNSALAADIFESFPVNYPTFLSLVQNVESSLYQFIKIQ